MSASFQDWGHARSTVLCFMPPSPADWIRWDMPSLRLDDTTSWQKPLVFSVPIRDRMFWGGGGSQACRPMEPVCQPHPPAPKGPSGGPGPTASAILPQREDRGVVPAVPGARIPDLPGTRVCRSGVAATTAHTARGCADILAHGEPTKTCHTQQLP